MKSEEEIANSKGQRAKSQEQRAEAKAKAKSEESSCWHWALVTAGVQSSDPIAIGFKARLNETVGQVQSLKKLNLSALSFAVEFIQRIKKHIEGNGLQPHILKMWLKPDSLSNISVRQLPACRTGRKQTACPDFSGAITADNCNLTVSHFDNFQAMRLAVRNRLAPGEKANNLTLCHFVNLTNKNSTVFQINN